MIPLDPHVVLNGWWKFRSKCLGLTTELRMKSRSEILAGYESRFDFYMQVRGNITRLSWPVRSRLREDEIDALARLAIYDSVETNGGYMGAALLAS
jgi:hypothetical protein